MKTRVLTPNVFKIRIMFLFALIVMALVMKIISIFNIGETTRQSAPIQPIVDKEMIYQAPEKSILLDGLAVTLKGAFVWNKAEDALLRETFMQKSVEAWTVLAADAKTLTPHTVIQ